MSPNARKEILQIIMVLIVLRGIASDIAESGYYSIMADVSNIEQLVICIHKVDKEMRVCEEYIGLMPVTQTNSYQRCAAVYESQNSRCSWAVL